MGSSWKIESVKVDFKNDSETWQLNKWLDKETGELELKTTKKILDNGKKNKKNSFFI